MNPSVAPLAAILDLNTDLLLNCLDELSDEEVRHRLPGGGNSLAFLLGVLAGVFEFIPFLGPLLALGPALMLGLAMGTKTAAYVVVLYVVVQTLEGYVLTPLVQRKVVELQPVVTITAQVALSWAAGPVGLLVAVPLVAVATVVVEMLYIEDRLRDRINPEFESVARAQVAEAAKGPLRGLFGE